MPPRLVDLFLDLRVALLCIIWAALPSYASASSFDSTTQSELKSLAYSKEWVRLLHYQHSWRGFKSEVDGAEFYLHKRGRRDPENELYADYEAFAKSQSTPQEVSDKRVECLFPARVSLIQRNITAAKNWKMPVCPRYDHFRGGIAAQSATLVFSSYYLNNPSSAFGHTFLRLNKKPDANQRFELLDYGVGYAATANTSNPLIFALGGMFGWFRGDFTNIPYYYKVQEYNDYESRDLWEYDLDLTPQEVEYLVAHLWELAHATIHYRYLNKNCSSLIITALEAAAPRLELYKHLTYWVIPADTVRVLHKQPGFLKGYKFRPSKRTQFVARVEQLSEEDKARLNEAIAARQDVEPVLEGLVRDKKTNVVDTLIDYYDYRFVKPLIQGDKKKTELKQKVLRARAQLPPQKEPFVAPEPKKEEPSIAHGSVRSGAGYWWSDKEEQALVLKHRFALHDLLDPRKGYPRDAEISFLEFNGRVWLDESWKNEHKNDFQLDEFYAFAVRTVAPYERMLPNVSWKVRIGNERVWDDTCLHNCLASVAGAGGGLTTEMNWGLPVFATVLVSGDYQYSGEFLESSSKLRLGPEFNLRALISRKWGLQANAQYMHIFLQDQKDAFKFQEELRYNANLSWALSAQATQLPQDEHQYQLQAYLFY